VPDLPRPVEAGHLDPRALRPVRPKAHPLSAALIALWAVTFALGIAAGNGPRLISTARSAAMDWNPRRAPNPFTQLMEGTHIMASDSLPGQRPDDDENGTGPGADVVDLDTARAARPGNGAAPAVVDPHPVEAVPADERTTEVPAADDGPVIAGTVVPVDAPGDGPRDWLAELHAAHRTRRAIVPAAVRSKAEAIALGKFLAAHYGHKCAYHATRTPKYGTRLAFRAPRGAHRVMRGAWRWTWDLEGQPVRLAAVLKSDPETYLKLARHRDRRVGGRLVVALVSIPAAVAVAIVIMVMVPVLGQGALLAAVVAALGMAGRPADAPPILDRAVIPNRVEKLTSDIVCRALGALGIAALSGAIAKNPRTALDFKAPITRDGPGWRADLDLTYGVTVAEVQEKRDKLASGLRRPIGCVWPEVDHAAHPGRLVLWVGDQDMSKARQAAWPLAAHGTVDLFRPVPFGTDQRGRAVKVTLMFTSGIIGSIPRMGKTFLLRLLALIAALDPRAGLYLFDLKGTGDLGPLETVAHRYRAGEEDDDIAYGLAAMRELKEELRRRARVIRDLPRDICPENKITPELAGRKSLGLHPIGVFVDECQKWFEHPQYGAELEAICTDLVKRGPALGIILLLATQRPDAKSLPTGISANAVLRWCLKVMGQLENDMVMGTSAYKNGTRATMFAFTDKGICYFSGEGDAPRIVRGYEVNGPAAERIAARARAMREAAGTLTGYALGEGIPADTGPAYDLLADIAAVMAEPKLWSETVVTRLADLRPAVYGPWAALEGDARAAQLTAALKPYDVRTGQVWGTTDDGKGANRRGITRDDITTAITERNEKR
jgi:DNA segregation ATPase FtsK/SpoIIIE, S-DNA-T family